MSLTIRVLKLGMAAVCLLLSLYYLFSSDSGELIVPALLAIISGILIFDSGHASAIDNAYSSIKHLKSKTDHHDLVLRSLARQQLKTTVAKLVSLKHDYPEDSEAIDIAITELEQYLNRKRWYGKRYT